MGSGLSPYVWPPLWGGARDMAKGHSRGGRVLSESGTFSPAPLELPQERGECEGV